MTKAAETDHEFVLSEAVSYPLLAEALDGHLVGPVVDVCQDPLLDDPKLSLAYGLVDLDALGGDDVLPGHSELLALFRQVERLVVRHHILTRLFMTCRGFVCNLSSVGNIVFVVLKKAFVFLNSRRTWKLQTKYLYFFYVIYLGQHVIENFR